MNGTNEGSKMVSSKRINNGDISTSPLEPARLPRAGLFVVDFSFFLRTTNAGPGAVRRAGSLRRAQEVIMLERCEKYERIAVKLLRLKEFDAIRPFVSFYVLSSDEEKHTKDKLILGECVRVAKNYSWCCPVDFLIIVYEPNIDHFDDTQLGILIRHELHHIGYDVSGNEPAPYIVPHDYEEFDVIMRKFGLDWAK